ncbi:MAG: SDR family NAD(P)-dependent oxidoreductase [Chloroflexaceae bacterium]|nr:SDR family NAD(P)-dependent oxidoreductase [Chloroflexaceae bacterium]
MAKWTAASIPDQTGKVVVVTGANSGLGYETTLALARKGAHIVMACRNMQKGEVARNDIARQVPNASLDVQVLDLASLASVRAFAEAFNSRYQQLDILYNNAGIMGIPQRIETADGFEMQFGTNHLGHFALTGLLLDAILSAPNSRVVTTTSVVHHMGVGQIHFNDLQRKNSYQRWLAYGQSKFANLLFTLELQRKLTAIGSRTISVAAHPGYSATHLQTTGPGMGGTKIELQVSEFINRYVAQSAAMGALPQLYAGTAPGVLGGDYYGPALAGFRGYPLQRYPNPAAFDAPLAAQLWNVSEELTGVRYTTFEMLAA